MNLGLVGNTKEARSNKELQFEYQLKYLGSDNSVKAISILMAIECEQSQNRR